MVNCLKWKRTWSQYFEIDERLVRALLHSVTIVLEVPKEVLKELACMLNEEQWHAETPKQALASPAVESEAI